MYDTQYIVCLWYCVDLLKGKNDLLYFNGEYSHKKKATNQTTTNQWRHNENGAFEGLGSLRPAQLLLIATTGEGGQLA